MFLTDVVHNKAAITDASRDCMIMVCCHHQMQPIWYLPNTSILALNLKCVGGNARLKFIRGPVVPAHNISSARMKLSGFDPIVEASKQAIAVINERTVLPENIEHDDAERTLAGTLLTAFEDDNDAGMLVRILHGPG